LKITDTSSYPVSIFIAGDIDKAAAICREHCDQVGLCVTVTPTKYVYTGGEEDGVIIGLINYPRFPALPRQLIEKAGTLAHKLIERMEQESCTIQAPDITIWISNRPEDNP
jgi:ferredoxin